MTAECGRIKKYPVSVNISTNILVVTRLRAL